MAKGRIGAGLLAGCLVVWGGAAFAATPAQILQYRPRQDGVVCTTPSAAEADACKVKWTKSAPGGVWLLVDAQGRPLRRLIDTSGDNKPHVWSYYQDGNEVYREMDTDGDGEPDQYRWLNAGGMKWGVDLNKDNKIDSWRMISAEEASQELLQAILHRDSSRLQALFITDAEMQALGLPAAQVDKLHEAQKQAYTRFQEACSKLTNLSDKTRWVHLETSAPQCLPADTIGTKQDLIKYGRGSILCETNGKHDWIQTGELIKVGLAWRLTEGPIAGDGGGSDGGATQVDPALQALLDQLRDHDSRAPKGVDNSGPSSEVVQYNLQRADLLEKIVAKVKPEEREQWIRQVADCLNTAAQHSPKTEKTAYNRLTRLEEQIVKAVPGGPLAAYVTFREMSADNASKLAEPGPDVAKVQEAWIDRLSHFVADYPKAEDTPEALMQLGMVSEFVNKEIEAKKWYARLAKDFPDHAMAPKAQGALRRLEIEGKPLELAGSLLNGNAFNIAQLRGKLVVVYYWASWNKDRCVADFAALKLLLDNYSSKGLALVCVSLDNTAEEAADFVQRTQAPGVHLFQPGGLESTLATQYGVMVLPNLFLVDKDGKVVSRTIQQVNGLEEEIKKRLN
jgi:peroxiredoxin